MDEMSLDDLMQRAANIQEARFIAHFAAAGIAAEAQRMGAGAVKAIAGVFRWTAHHFNRMALLAELPEDMAWPDAPLGIYWAAVQAFEGDELEARLREALLDDWSVTKARREWGLSEPQEHPQLLYEGEARSSRQQYSEDGCEFYLLIPPHELPRQVRVRVYEAKKETSDE